MKYDLLIKNGNVINLLDNSSSYRSWDKLDIGIKSDRIVKIGDLKFSEAKETIDATNLVISPGFIDIHSHSDNYLIANPKAESKIRQGVTTEVIGNCGISAAPLGTEYKPPKSIITDNIKTNWTTMSDYLTQLEKGGSSVNVVPLVGHNNIRGVVMGYSSEIPSSKQLGQMKEVLQEAFDAGVWGMSTGLIMPPGSFSTTEEIVELCKLVAKNKGVYHTHLRGQGDRLLSATMEAIDIAKKSNVPLHILHHKGMGDANAAKVEFTLSMIDDANNQGMNITLDMYPYLAGQGGLAMFLPTWVHEGGAGKLIERLKDQKLRKKIKYQMVEPELITGYQSYTRELGWQTCWDKILICNISSKKNKSLIGQSIAEAKPDCKDPMEFVFDLLIDEQGDVAVVIPDLIDIDDRYFQMVIRHPITMFGSDGYALATYGSLGEGVPHPRSYGSFPRVLGRFVRQRRLFTWKEAIRKMTYLPAKFLGIKDRGIIKEGMYADIVIFNPETVIDNSTFSKPHQYPTGINYVITNGTVVIQESKHTGKLPGRVLRHNN